MEIHNVHIAMLQGTRSKFGGDRTIGEYKIFYEAAGTNKIESYTGLAIVIRTSLLNGAQIKKMSWHEGRILALRVKNKFYDMHLISAYSPGDHLCRDVRNKFWHTLRKGLAGVPKRSSILLGMDANGHIGRDPGPGIGGETPERWTENGLELQRTCTELHLTALNTIQGCKHTDWTWQRRDGRGCTRIDYLLSSNRLLSQVSINHGANDVIKFELQGA